MKSWHCRLGHPSSQVLTKLVSTQSLPMSAPRIFSSHCDSFLSNKSHKLPFGASSISCTRPLEIIYTDVWGPAPIISYDHYRYYVIFVDYFTKYTWLYPLKHKSDVTSIFERFKTIVENYFATTIQTVYSNGGGEYQSLSHVLSHFGIQYLKSPPHTPQVVGIAERKHRHVVETGLALLHHVLMPLYFWTFAFQTTTYLINRLPTPILGHQSPFEKLFKKRPNYTKLRVFGCLCDPWLRLYAYHKLDPRSCPCVFIGYSLEHNVYHCFDLVSHKLFVSRHVAFVESEFPFHTLVLKTDRVTNTSLSHWSLLD